MLELSFFTFTSLRLRHCLELENCHSVVTVFIILRILENHPELLGLEVLATLKVFRSNNADNGVTCYDEIYTVFI